MRNIFFGILAVLTIGCSKDETTETGTEIPMSVTDIDGNIYNTVNIGNQTWLQKNLNVSKYRNGDPIPQVQDPDQWATLTTGAWRYYDDDPENGEIYGKLYNWYAVKDPRGLAPEGCHVPSDKEWTTLSTFLGSSAGGEMKAVDIANWTYPNTDATDNSNFTGLPGGIVIKNGTFHFIGDYGYWWSSTGIDASTAWNRSLGYNSEVICRSYDNKNYGFSVRCILK
ncbi:MAG: fibrobacter succinogenes major paralogous domain-containing protein [Flavobacterium sp.]